MEYIILATFAEFFSTAVSYSMLNYSNNYILKKIGDKGYKVIDNMTCDTINLLNQDELVDKASKIKLCIPIYNLIYAKKLREESTKKQLNRLIEDGLIVKMNSNEDKEFKRISDSDEKMLYVLNNESYRSQDIRKQESVNRYIVKSVNKLAEKYTSSEVDSLSNVFEKQYVLGTVNNEKVAILGAYDCDLSAKLPRLISYFDGADFKMLPKDNYGSEEFTTYTYKLPSNNKRFSEIQKNIYIAKKMVELMANKDMDTLNQPKKLVK